VVCHCPFDELGYGVIMLLGVLLLQQINLVLEDYDPIQLHYLDGGQMFAGLGLGTRFVAGDEELHRISSIFIGRSLRIHTKAASITAAPESMVLIRISCPGQSFFVY
jgi:hypothetical protein